MKRFIRSFALLLTVAVLGLTPALAESLWFDGTRLEVDDVYSASNDPIELKVTFWQSLDEESLDDKDLWVISQNGFQQLATFVRLERQDFGPDGEDGAEPPEIEGEERLPAGWEDDFAWWNTAVYHILPVAEEWSDADNGRYAVLLEPNEVVFTGGGAASADYLGDFHLRIGEPQPAIPEEVEIAVRETEAGAYVANIVYHYSQGPIEVISEGSASQEENRIGIDFEAVFGPGGFTDAPERFEFEYELPELQPGIYSLHVTSHEQDLAWQRFSVRGDGGGEIEAEVELWVDSVRDRQIAYSTLHFADPYYVLTDGGEVTRDGETFTINVNAEQVVFVQEPDQTIFEQRHDLGSPEPGHYRLVYAVNGQVIDAIEFHVEEDGFEIPASAQIAISQDEDKVIGNVTVTIEPSAAGIYHIGDWGEPRQEGNTIYLDATSNGPLEIANAETYVADHAYLLHGEDDDNGEGRPIKFETLEPIPVWLRPLDAQQLVFRTEDEWSAWIEENWPPSIFGAPPEIPVDFDQHMVIVVYGGEVDQGIDVSITGITGYSDSVVVDYLTSYPGIQPEDGATDRPAHMVAIAQTDLPIRFNGDTIAFPSPPPVEEPLEIAAQELEAGAYEVVFRIDGVAYASAEFTIDAEGAIPARASIEISEGTASSASALVEVAFTGFPYHTVSDWGPVLRQGNHFILDAEASEVNFVQEPELPYFESHVYPLTLFSGKEPVDFKRVDDLRLQKEREQNVVIQTTQEWWDLIGFEPGPLVLPAPDPVNFDEVTLVIVFAGAKPNGCYNVGIQEVFAADGVINVCYRERLPDPRELCTQAIVYPMSAIALEKTDSPIDFIQKADQVGGDVNVANADEDPDADPFPGVFNRGTLYTVEFRMNGVAYARTSFRGNDVIEPTPLPEPFVDWLDVFLPELALEGAAGGDEDDANRQLGANHDGDRWTNFEEFLLGLDPTNPSEASGIWTEWVADDGGERQFAICFKRRKDAVEHADFVVEVSQDLSNWVSHTDFVLEPTIRDLGGDLEEVTICLAPKANVEGFPFARLVIEEK